MNKTHYKAITADLDYTQILLAYLIAKQAGAPEWLMCAIFAISVYCVIKVIYRHFKVVE